MPSVIRKLQFSSENWTLRKADQKHLASLKCGVGKGSRSFGPMGEITDRLSVLYSAVEPCV